MLFEQSLISLVELRCGWVILHCHYFIDKIIIGFSYCTQANVI